MKTMTFRASVFAASILFLIFASGCSRNNNNNSNPTGTYFFTATFLGQNYNFTNQFIQRGDDYRDVGGYVPNNNFGQAGGIFLNNIDSTTRNKVLGLANTTYTFSPTALINPDVAINTGGFTFYHTMTTTDPSYNVKINNIVYLRTDSAFSTPEDVYAVTGTFKAKMQDPTTGAFAGDATGSFNIQCTAEKY